MIRLGLCCKYLDEPIRFRTATATHLLKLSLADRLQKLSGLILTNAEALEAALRYNAAHGIGAFRINSQILPLYTHPQAGYTTTDLPDGEEIEKRFKDAGQMASDLKIRLSFHPDQFVVLNSPRPDVVANSMKELAYQSMVAEWVGADVINIHAGGVYGDKPAALGRFRETFKKLPTPVRERLTLENDDRSYTPKDLFPLCRDLGVPMVYDVHHHRCLPDGWSVEEATEKALSTWDREPLFHISSPKEGWDGPRPNRHQDYIDFDDFPEEWHKLDLTIEVEAKAKEKAIARLREQLGRYAAR